jgi:hypothetical protein
VSRASPTSAARLSSRRRDALILSPLFFETLATHIQQAAIPRPRVQPAVPAAHAAQALCVAQALRGRAAPDVRGIEGVAVPRRLLGCGEPTRCVERGGRRGDGRGAGGAGERYKTEQALHAGSAPGGAGLLPL